MNTSDTVNSPFAHEVQGVVARLLSTENIKVHRSTSYSTAFFDVEKRLLGLPIFKDISKDVYDMLIGHEVGHALYTNMNDFKDFLQKHKSKMLYNVLEDIRIEKLIQSTYPGLISIFHSAYKTLLERKFFGDISPEKIAEMGLLDRLNLRAKLGSKLYVPFTAEEQDVVNEALTVRTHADIDAVALKIRKLLKKKKSKKDKNENQAKVDMKSPSDELSEQPQPEPSDEQPQNESRESENTETTEDDAASRNVGADEDSREVETGNEQSDDTLSDDELTSETQESYDNMVSTLNANSSNDFEFTEPSPQNISNAVVDYKTMLSRRDMSVFYINRKKLIENPVLLNDFKDFRKECKSTVVLLKNEFERLRAAHQYTRSSLAQRGVLNVNALHRYKFSDDIFLRIAQTPDAKSHGMVFLLDYSSSMSGKIKNIIKKLVLMTDFCKSVSIPFTVYTFTSKSGEPYERQQNANEIDISKLIMHEVLTSKMSKSQYARAVEDLYFLLFSESETMHCTPLLESLIVCHKLIKDFKAEHKTEIVNFIMLTDGQGQELDYKSIEQSMYMKKIGYGSIFGSRRFALNRDHGAYWKNFKTIIENMRNSLGINVMYFFASYNKREMNQLVNDIFRVDMNMAYSYSQVDSFMQILRKQGINTLKNSVGCTKLILMFDSGYDDDDDDEFDKISSSKSVELSENEIKTLFMKHMTNKRTIRTFVSEFISAVAKAF